MSSPEGDGPQQPTVWSEPAPATKFYADNNVHRRGRALRTLGYDTKLFGEGPDETLCRLAAEEGRIVLSCDFDFANNQQALVLQSVDWQQQLKVVVRTFKLDPHSFRYSLCLNCNCAVHLTPPSQHVK